MSVEWQFSDQIRYTTGVIRILEAGQPLPEGWLWCDSAEYRSEDYPQLAQTIGYSFGGAPTESFRVPLFDHGIIKT